MATLVHDRFTTLGVNSPRTCDVVGQVQLVGTEWTITAGDNAISSTNTAGTDTLVPYLAGAVNYQVPQAGLCALLRACIPYNPHDFYFALVDTGGNNILRLYTVLSGTNLEIYVANYVLGTEWSSRLSFGRWPCPNSSSWLGYVRANLCLYVRAVRGAGAATESLIEAWIQVPYFGKLARPESPQWLCVHLRWIATPTNLSAKLALVGAATKKTVFGEFRWSVGGFDPAAEEGVRHTATNFDPLSGAINQQGIAVHAVAYHAASGRILHLVDHGLSDGAANTPHAASLYSTTAADGTQMTAYDDGGGAVLFPFSAGDAYVHRGTNLLINGDVAIAVATKREYTGVGGGTLPAWMEERVRVSVDGGAVFAASFALGRLEAGGNTFAGYCGQSAFRCASGRWVFSDYYNNALAGRSYIRLFYSDVSIPDAAEDWTIVTITPTHTVLAEPVLFERSDGTLMLMCRNTAAVYPVKIVLDAAYAIVSETEMNGQGGAGFLPMRGDPAGGLGLAAFGKLWYCAHPLEAARRRNDTLIYTSSDDGLTWDLHPISPYSDGPGYGEVYQWENVLLARWGSYGALVALANRRAYYVVLDSEFFAYERAAYTGMDSGYDLVTLGDNLRTVYAEMATVANQVSQGTAALATAAAVASLPTAAQNATAVESELDDRLLSAAKITQLEAATGTGFVKSEQYAATDWYVKATGNDALDGHSWATAKLTLAATFAAMADGDRVFIGSGIWTEDNLEITASHIDVVANRGTIIRGGLAATGPGLTLSGEYIRVRGDFEVGHLNEEKDAIFITGAFCSVDGLWVGDVTYGVNIEGGGARISNMFVDGAIAAAIYINAAECAVSNCRAPRIWAVPVVILNASYAIVENVSGYSIVANAGAKKNIIKDCACFGYTDSGTDNLWPGWTTLPDPTVAQIGGTGPYYVEALTSGGAVIATAADVLAQAKAALGADWDPAAVETGVTLRKALQRIGALAGVLSGAGTGTEVLVGLDGVTPRIRATVDAEGNRTVVQFDPP